MSNYAIRGGLYQRHPFTTATVSFSEHLLAVSDGQHCHLFDRGLGANKGCCYFA
jgi:hypothetical protein